MKTSRQKPGTKTTAPDEANKPNRTDEPVARWLRSQSFSDIDRHFARFLERLSGTPNPEVALAAALASRSQSQGNICLDLRSVAGTTFPNGDGDAGFSLPLPELDDWIAALRKAPVVGKPTEFRPLVLDERGRLYLHRYWEYESDLAKAILCRAEQEIENVNEPLLREGLERLFPAAQGATETDWQRVAAATAVKKNFCVISGGPGTGKTRTVIALLVLLMEQAGGKPLRITLAAPTGKAAARLQESLEKWKATLPCADAIKTRLPDESFTLHRLLGGLPDSAQFKRNAKNPLPLDVVVVDEASMVDLALMAKLFAAVPPSARLILVGDMDQLTSVEAGAVLGDICHGAPWDEPVHKTRPLSACIVSLRKNYRFGADNGILVLSRAINQEGTDRAVELLRGGIGTGFSGIAGSPLPTKSQLKARLSEQVIAGFRPVLEAGDPAGALKALNRFRILSPLRKGPYGVESLNQIVEEILREARLIPARDQWFAGRPIQVLRNDPTLKLFNGDTGILLPDSASGGQRAWFLDADGSARGVIPLRLPEHETVFAMTVHKSQGSEFEEVLLVLPDRDSPVLTRELLYTGVTRASRRVEIWFNEPIFRAALGRRLERASGLRETLWGQSMVMVQHPIFGDLQCNTID